eukprot:821032-Amorphochlora_amoeboformis.AAC.1
MAFTRTVPRPRNAGMSKLFFCNAVFRHCNNKCKGKRMGEGDDYKREDKCMHRFWNIKCSGWCQQRRKLGNLGDETRNILPHFRNTSTQSHLRCISSYIP